MRVNKDLRPILQALSAQGFECQATTRGHISVRLSGRVVAVFAGTAGDWRSRRNTLADLQRHGFVWPSQRGRSGK